ncbi:carotenoid oxygenase [Melampsora americana]|nr:carotenoid oxygenase [Melampsora americana]
MFTPFINQLHSKLTLLSDHPIKHSSQIENKTKNKLSTIHPFLSGNFAPVQIEHSLTLCQFSGVLPDELVGGQYLRNGANPLHLPAPDQPYHWFDGDGMIHGVYFSSPTSPLYVNRFVETDIYRASKRRGSSILPSIASLISPISSPASLLATILRAVFINWLSNVSRLTVANTALVFHDRRLLATCESGPTVAIHAPQLDTIDYHVFPDEATGKNGLGQAPLLVGAESTAAGHPMGGMLEEWTTGHPKVDPINGELVFIGYNIFARPFVTHSVVSHTGHHISFKKPIHDVTQPKMMHDFGASHAHTVLLDLPLTMDPINLLKPGAPPIVHFDRTLSSRFGVFPRYDPSAPRWFTAAPSLILHTANTWDSTRSSTLLDLGLQSKESDHESYIAVNMLACRFRTAKLVYTAGDLEPPLAEQTDQDIVRLTYYRFSLSENDPLWSGPEATTKPSHLFALSAIPFEFPVLPPSGLMNEVQWVYGCSMASGSFDAGLRGGARPNVLVKMNVRELISRGLKSVKSGTNTPKDQDGIFEVDPRTMPELLKSEPDPSIRLLELPKGFYLQEPSFIARKEATKEDQGWLVCYVFDESQLKENGEVTSESHSELWVLDAELIGEGRRWEEVLVSRVQLPSRVPYGLHSTFINSEQIQNQRSNLRPKAPDHIDVENFKVVKVSKIEKCLIWILRLVLVCFFPVFGFGIGDTEDELEDL